MHFVKRENVVKVSHSQFLLMCAKNKKRLSIQSEVEKHVKIFKLVDYRATLGDKMTTSVITTWTGFKMKHIWKRFIVILEYRF